MTKEELYINKLEEQNTKLRDALKWKMELEEYLPLFQMVIANFVQLTNNKKQMHNRIQEQIKDYPYYPHPLTKSSKATAKEIVKLLERKMRGEFSQLKERE